MQEKASRCRRLTGEVLLLQAVKIIFVSFEWMDFRSVPFEDGFAMMAWTKKIGFARKMHDPHITQNLVDKGNTEASIEMTHH